VSRLIRKRQVLSTTGLSNAQLYRLMMAGLFPSNVDISCGTGRSVAWEESAVQAWIEARIQSASKTQRAVAPAETVNAAGIAPEPTKRHRRSGRALALAVVGN